MASAHQDSETEATPAMPSQPMTFSSDHLVGTSQQQQSLQTELHRHPEVGRHNQAPLQSDDNQALG